MKLLFVAPALDEACSVGGVVDAFLARARALGHSARFVVCDNGSTDDTAAVARAAGAVVVVEPRRGYGAACLRALVEVAVDDDAVVFVDADGACDVADLDAVVDAAAAADLVIGSRVVGAALGRVDDGALTAGQVAGSVTARLVLRWLYGHHTTDLGPFRLVRTAALRRLQMSDRDFGWTVQMQARAARVGLRVVEVPVAWRRRRAGVSKVSGNVRASFAAARIIAATLWRERRFGGSE
jgi:glycosyltransferase involved in cell wall biosynthesis